MPDAFADADGDGIADAIDLCPSLNAADNHDQDSDMLGDPCDPCPFLSTNVDGDGDGVGDLCDPHPTQAIDHRVAFYGFYASSEITAWQKTGSWTISAGRLTTNNTFSTLPATITSPDTFGSDITITASVNIQSLSTSTTVHRTASIQQLRATSPTTLHKCGLDQLNLTTEVNYQIVNTSTMVNSGGTIAFPEAIIGLHEYKLSFAAMTGTCGVDSPARTFNRPSGTAAGGPVGINAELSQISVDYMFVVQSN
jgi:hypothetical protein